MLGKKRTRNASKKKEDFKTTTIAQKHIFKDTWATGHKKKNSKNTILWKRNTERLHPTCPLVPTKVIKKSKNSFSRTMKSTKSINKC